MNFIGDITGYIDLAQILLYLFWLFFAGLIYYLVREGHREGYPMESDSLGRAVIMGFPVPPPKTYKLLHGGEVTVPDSRKDARPLPATRTAASPGSPIEPTGDPMAAGIGPGAWTPRSDHPDLTSEGQPKLRPLRVLGEFGVSTKDVDPRGLPVVAGDMKVAGQVVDLWVDTAEMTFRYLEVESGTGAVKKRVLLPLPFARVRRNQVEVTSIYAHHFADVPALRKADEVTMLEEERIVAYYGGGLGYADPKRLEAWM